MLSLILKLATERFSIRFVGDAVESGAIDVKDLAPTLLAVGELIEESNRVLNKGRASVKVSIRPDFQSGSFEGFLELAVSFFDMAKNLFSDDKPLDARGILEIIGFSVATVATTEAAREIIPTLYELIRKVGVRKPISAMKVQTGDVSITLDDSDVLKSRNMVFDLYSDGRVNKAFVKVAQPVEREGIESIQLGIKAPDSNALPMEITKKDLPIMEILEERSEGFEVLEESTSVRVLSVERVDFSGELKWALNDGAARIHASILDTDFLERVERGEIAFTRGSLIRAEVKVAATRTRNGKLSNVVCYLI